MLLGFDSQMIIGFGWAEFICCSKMMNMRMLLKGKIKRFLLILSLFLSVLDLAAQERQTCVTTTRNPWEWPGHNNFFLAPSTGGKGFIYNFRDNSVTALGGGTNVIGGYEGISSASDDGGELVMFTNGLTAYDASGNKTYAGLKEGNESGMTTYGSASQGVMTVRHPLAPFKYYVLTTDDALGGTNGFNYAVFDENGAVTTPSTRLTSFKIAEGISATFHDNGVDIWVTVLKVGSTEFHTFLLTCDGFVDPAVVSKQAYSVTGQWERGGIAFNWDGTRIASAFPQAWPTGDAVNTLRVYDFDNKTGVISNGESFAPNTGFTPYDLVFGADNQTLYISEVLKGVSTYNTNAGNIAGSRQSFSMPNGSHLGLELGADGYVYSAGSGGMYRINGASGGTTDMNVKSSNGISSMYIPPAEEPDILEVGPFCDTVTTPIDLYTEWVCSHVDSEIGIRQADATHGYFGDGIVNSDSGQIKGLFQPSLAKAGRHMVEFRFCDVNDTIWIEVVECKSCEVELDDVQPELCAGDPSLLLDDYVALKNGPGIWTIDSVPSSPGVSAILDESSDTLFDASAIDTKSGTYKLIYTVTGIGSTCKDSVYVVVNPLPKPDLGPDQEICSGDPLVTFDAGAFDLFSWDYNNETTQQIQTETARDYIVEVTDDKGCKGKDTVVLSVHELPEPFISNDTICEGDSAVEFHAGNYDSYQWGPIGGIDAFITVDGAGFYTVEVVDSNGCIGDTVVELVVNPLPVVDLGVDQEICAEDPAVEFDAGNPGYDFIWNTGSVNQTLSTDSAGEYFVEITDLKGCKDSDTVVLTVHDLPIPFVENDTICKGSSPVELIVNEYADYTWSTGETTRSIQVDQAGSYTVEVVDSNGCIGDTIAELLVNEVPEPFVEDLVMCTGETSVTFTTQHYAEYNWDSGVSSDSMFTTDLEGIHTLHVIDENGCEGDTVFELTTNDKPIPFIENDTICKGDPAVQFDAGNYASFEWSTGDLTQLVELSDAGIYTVEVTDSNGCKEDTVFELIVNDLPIPFVENDTICAGDGVVEFRVGHYVSYVWDNGASTDSVFTTDVPSVYNVEVTDSNGCVEDTSFQLTVNSLPIPVVENDTICEGDGVVNFQVGNYAVYSWNSGAVVADTFETDVEGVYTIEVTDSNGCKEDTVFELVVNDLPIPFIPNDTICDGDSPVDFDGGNYVTYNWNNGQSTDQILSTNAANVYHIEVSDSNGCYNDTIVELVVNPNPIVNIGPDHEICTMDPAVEIDGGGLNATYLWNTGEDTQFIQIHDEGEYSLIFADSNGCLGYDTLCLKVNDMPVVAMPDQTICLGDPQVTFDAGVGFTTYNWSTDDTSMAIQVDVDGEYIVDFVDDKGCSGSDTVVLVVNPLPTPDLGPDRTICADASPVNFFETNYNSYVWNDNSTNSNLETDVAGFYSVEVTDTNGCLASDTVELIVIPLPDPNVLLDVSMCPGMSATLDASVYDNGNGGYSYLWHDGSTNDRYVATTEESVSVEITDSYGCKGSDGAEVTTEQNLSVAIIGAPKIDLCAGRNTDLIPNYKAVDGYNFLWSNQSTSEIINVDSSGFYNVHVDNGLGCEGDATIEVEIHPVPSLQTSTAAMCNGEAVTIGNDLGAAYVYNWNTNENTAQIVVDKAGRYTQFVEDAVYGCSNATYVDVVVHSNPVVDLGNDIEVCEGVDVVLSEVTPNSNASLLWSTQDTIPSIQVFNSGDYSLKVTSNQGCVGHDTVNVKFIPIPYIDLGPDINLCEGETGVVNADVQNLNYTWSTGELTSSFDVNQTNTHIITVSNQLCSSTDTIQVNVVPLPTSEIDHSLDNKFYCFDDLDGRGVHVSAGSNPSYDYVWGTGETTPDISLMSAGTYVVNISVGNCFITDRITINEYCPSTLYVPNTFTPNNDGKNDSFNAEGTNITDYHMYIFDRWGMLLYESESMDNDWDGTFKGREAQIDTYVYKIYYSMNHPDGNPRQHQKVGHVNIVR